MKKIFLFIMTFFIFFSSSYSRRLRIVEEIPWELVYSINEFGERDKIIGAQCGKWAMRESVYVDKNGITIGSNERDYNLVDSINSISFLFDSKDKLVLENDIIDKSEETYSRERKFYISKNHKDFKKIIDKIKKSNQMSILLIDNLGNKKTISEISNLGATNILNKVLK